MTAMNEALRRRIESIAGRVVAAATRIERGYTPAERWVLRFVDGGSAFGKVGATAGTAAALRTEHRRYGQLAGDFMPALLGFDDDPAQPVLLLEDLSGARWPPPWGEGDLEALKTTLDRVARSRPLSDDLPPLAADFPPETSGWAEVARAPEPFLALDLCSEEWLRRALPLFVDAQRDAVVDGDDSVHHDVRSDNLCVRGGRVVLIDWNCARRGNAAFELAFAAPSIRLEGGPLPEELVGDGAPLAAVVSGFFAARAGLAPVPNAPRVRWIQRRQGWIALAWVARALGLPRPDGRWSQAALTHIEAAHADGTLDDHAWHTQIEELIGDAYLASEDPRAQSGKSGDEIEWRWARELALDARPDGGSFLDVGCANGYLMESVHRWGAERGIPVEPYGLDISWRLAALARRRLPAWSPRIWTGNAMDWAPPRRFDLVHTGIDYVPAARRHAYLTRLLRDVVAPGGALVIRAERVIAGAPDLPEQIRALGFAKLRVLERKDPRSNAVRRTACLDAL